MGHTFRGPAFDGRDGTIVWGFTAMVLDALFDAAGWTVPWDATVERTVRPLSRTEIRSATLGSLDG